MRLVSVLAGLAVAVSPIQAQDSLWVRVVDVGPGLCTITRAPGDVFMVYDAGHWQGRRCLITARELIPAREIDLMIISHSDADHLGDAAEILGEFRVLRVIHTGHQRTSASWTEMMDSLASEVRHQGASVRSLSTHPLTPGERVQLGDEAVVTLVAGWAEWPSPAGLSSSELANAISIVARVDYAGRSVLFAGDAVGRSIGDPPSTCEHSEAAMVEAHRQGRVPLAADVLIAPHHGADNASSTCFVDAVDPRWVVFSAGHAFGHPRSTTAERFLAESIPATRLLRTDRGDDEGSGSGEWSEGRIPGCSDARGDDDVGLVIWEDGAMGVDHVRAAGGC